MNKLDQNKSLFLKTYQQQLDELLTFIDFSEGLTIGFIEVDTLEEMNWIISTIVYHEQCCNYQFIVCNFDNQEMRFLLDEITKFLSLHSPIKDNNPILIITGLENSIGLGDYPPVLQNLNYVRDSFISTVPYPILFCLPSYAVTRVAKFAPDFWAWKSGLFQFPSITSKQFDSSASLGLEIANLTEYNRFQKHPEPQSRIDLLKRLLEENQQNNNLRNQVTILQQLGIAYLTRGELKSAEDSLLNSLQLGEKLESLTYVSANTFEALGDLYSQQRNFDQAENYYQQALSFYSWEKSPEKWANLQNLLGESYGQNRTVNYAEKVELAIECYYKALQVYTESDFPANWAITQNNLAIAFLYRIRGDKAENLELSIKCYHKVLQVYTRSNFPVQWAATQNNLAIAYQKRIRGDKAENLELSIKCYHNALQVRTQFNFPVQWATTQNNLATAYRERILGDKAENLELSLECYHKVLQVYTQSYFPLQWATTQNNLATAYRERIRGDKAENLELSIECYHNALQVRTPSDFPIDWAETQNNLGNTYRERIRGDKADNLELSIECYHNALQVRTKSDFPIDWAETQNNLGNTYRERIRGDKADNLEWSIECYHNALQVRTPSDFPLECLQTARNLGNLHYDNHNWEEATHAYNLAIEALENSRLSALNPERRQKILSDAIIVYYRIIQSYLHLNQPDKALEYVERSKTRELVERISNRDIYPTGVSETIKQELQQRRQAIISEEHQLANEERKRNLPENQQSVTTLDYSHLNQLKTELQEFITHEITPIDPNFVLTQQVKPIPFPEIQSLIDEQTSILEWYIGEDSILAFIVHPHQYLDNGKIKGLKVWQSSLEEFQALEDWINDYLKDYYQNRDEWIKSLSSRLQKLSQILHLNQIINYEEIKQSNRLIIIPHWFLHLIPFHSLPVLPLNQDQPNNPNDENQLFSDYFSQGISYVPSCQVLKITQNLKRPHFNTFFAVQNPTNDLLFTDIEVQIIKSLFSQPHILAHENAIESVIKTDNNFLSTHCAHFSCHGSFNPDLPLESGLLLANKDILTLGEIFELNLENCRLVTLSACETGLVDIQSRSDEYVSLPSGFLFAGSPTVVSSLWTVDDFSTAFLMMKFYENLQIFPDLKAGEIAIALKQAQYWLKDLTVEQFNQELETIKPLFDQAVNQLRPGQQLQIKEYLKKIRNRQPYPFENPYYWAGFVTSGF